MYVFMLPTIEIIDGDDNKSKYCDYSVKYVLYNTW